MKVFDSQGREKLAGGGAGDGLNRISAGTQLAGTLATVVFSNSNNVTFGMTNSSIVTGSAHGNVSAGTTSNNLSAVVFSNSNGLAFGLNGSTVTGSYTVPTVTNSSWTVSDSVTSLTVARLAFTNLNGVTATLSTTTGGSATVVMSHNGLTSQSNQNVTANNGGFAFQTLSFSNVNGISFGTSAGSAITASHNAITTGRASTDAIGLATAQTNVTWTVNSAGLSFNAAGYAGTVTAATNATLTLNSAGLSISVAAGGGGGVLPGVSTGGNTSGSTGTISTGVFVLVGSNGISLRQSTGAAGSAATVTIDDGANAGFNPYHPINMGAAAFSQASLQFYPMIVEKRFSMDRLVAFYVYTQATGSTLTVTNSLWWGLYTKNASTMSLHTSGSGSFSINGSGTASSNQNSGWRYMTYAHTGTIPAGNYYLGIVQRSTTAGANATLSVLTQVAMASTMSGLFGVASNTSAQVLPGVGVWTSTTAGMPGSVAFSNVRGNSSAFMRPPVVYFTSGTQ